LGDRAVERRVQPLALVVAHFAVHQASTLSRRVWAISNLLNAG
jgi:hypothetical protein